MTSTKHVKIATYLKCVLCLYVLCLDMCILTDGIVKLCVNEWCIKVELLECLKQCLFFSAAQCLKFSL